MFAAKGSVLDTKRRIEMNHREDWMKLKRELVGRSVDEGRGVNNTLLNEKFLPEMTARHYNCIPEATNPPTIQKVE